MCHAVMAGSNQALILELTLQFTFCMTVFYPTHSQMFDFQNSDFIVLVHTNGLGYHQNAPFGKHSSVDFLWEVLSTLGLQGVEGEGEGPGGRGGEEEGQLSSAQSEALVPN